MNNQKLSNSGNIKKGQKLNPAGRPKGAKGKKYNIKDRLLGKWKIHPADRLVGLAKEMENRGEYEEAAKIWANLLKYFEPSKKPVESPPEKTTPEESADAADETYKLLQELEQDGISKDESGERSAKTDKRSDGVQTGSADSSTIRGS